MKVMNIEYHLFLNRIGQWMCRVDYSEIHSDELAYVRRSYTTLPHKRRWAALNDAEVRLESIGVVG